MKPIEIIATDLFEKVRSRFTNLQMGDDSGMVTADPTAARFFDFDFTVEGNNLGRVSISINQIGNLKVFYSQGIMENADSITQTIWYDFLKEMRFFAKRRLLRFDTRDITKNNLEKEDFQFLAQTAPKDPNMNESTMFGSTKTSHRKLEDTDLIIRHSEAIDPDKPGARSRKIKNLFIQNKEGERFKFPFIYLPGARAMQRHVANGGYPHDKLGQHIVKTCEEILKLSDFGRKVKHATLNDNAHGIVERAGQKLKSLRMHLEGMCKQGYYESYAESYAPQDDLIELDDATMESYKDTFTINKFDESLLDVFPILHKIMQEAGEIDLEAIVHEGIEEEASPLLDRVKQLLQTFEQNAMEIGAYGDPDINKIIQHLKTGDAESAAEVVWYSYSDQDGGEVPQIEPLVDDLQADFEDLVQSDNNGSEKGFEEFESWAEEVTNESFSDDELQALEQLVQERLPVGANDEAVQALAGIGIKDPALVKALRAQAAMPNGAEADARETIKTFMGADAGKISFGDLDSQPIPVEQPVQEIVDQQESFQRGQPVKVLGKYGDAYGGIALYIRPLDNDPNKHYITDENDVDQIVPADALAPLKRGDKLNVNGLGQVSFIRQVQNQKPFSIYVTTAGGSDEMVRFSQVTAEGLAKRKQELGIEEGAYYGPEDFQDWLKDATYRVAHGKVSDWTELAAELSSDLGFDDEKADRIAQRIYGHDKLAQYRVKPQDDIEKDIPRDDGDDDDTTFLQKLRGQARSGSIKPGADTGEIDEGDDEGSHNRMKEVAEVVSGFYNREDGTWTKGEHGVVTHVKRHFSDEEGNGGDREAGLAAELIKHLNSKHSGKDELGDVKKLAGVDEAPNKSDIPAYKRKQSGNPDWKVSTKDLEDEKTKSPTSSAGLARRKQELGMSESFEEILKLAGLAK
jgi:hypothetical protein